MFLILFLKIFPKRGKECEASQPNPLLLLMARKISNERKKTNPEITEVLELSDTYFKEVMIKNVSTNNYMHAWKKWKNEILTKDKI